MATIIKRNWLSKGATGHKVQKVAYGYTLQVNGKQERKFDAAWSREDAQNALAERVLERDTPATAPPPEEHTFADAVARYLATKDAEGKRSIRDDRLNLARLRAALGAETPLRGITADLVSTYKTQRLAAPKQRGGDGQRIAPATLNRELAGLRLGGHFKTGHTWTAQNRP